MASRQLPGTVVRNFFIKNTFINIVDTCAQDEEGGREANEGRRTRSAPPKMRSPPEDGSGSPRDSGAKPNGRITIAEDTEMADQVAEGGSEASEGGEGPEQTPEAVSYTHLALPTTPYV